MHYYQFNIGDYMSHTRHLTLMEDIVYRRLLDWYYLNEKPIPLDYVQAARLIQAKDNFPDVETILNEFFIQTDDGWINKRADKEINIYQGFSEAGKRGAAKRWGKGGDSPPIAPLIANNKHKTITINHKTENNKKEIAIKPDGIDDAVFNDFLKLRKAKRAPLTETALSGITKEATKAGITLQTALEICCKRGWQSFDAGWDWKPKNDSPQPKKQKML